MKDKLKYLWLIPASFLVLLFGMTFNFDEDDPIEIDHSSEQSQSLFENSEEMILEKHPDYVMIKNSDAFHNWVSEQSQDIQDWTYNNPSNSELAIDVLDLYKKDHPNLGCFEGDCINGEGTYFFTDMTNNYSGEFKDGVPHGQGITTSIVDDLIYRAAGKYEDSKPIDITNWKLVQIGLIDENQEWYMSLDSVENKGDYTYLLDLDSWVNSSATNHIQIDCKASKVRPIETVFYADVMALGEPVQIIPNDEIPMPPDWLDIDSTPKARIFNALCATVAVTKETKRYNKVYNACLLDKAQGMSMEVDSVRDAVEGACDEIAKDPSWLDNWKYN